MAGFDDYLKDEDEDKGFGKYLGKAPVQQGTGFDTYLGKTEQPRPTPTQPLPSPSVSPETLRTAGQATIPPPKPYYPTREEADIAFFKETGKMPGVGESGIADPDVMEDPVRLALMFGIPASAPVSIGSKALGTVGGQIAGTAATGAGFNLAYETADKLYSQKRLPTLGEAGTAAAVGAVFPTALKYGGKAAGKGVGKVADRFGAKVKQVARAAGTSPQQINKQLQKTVKEAAEQGVKTDRGKVLDDLIAEHLEFQSMPSRRMAAEKILPENFDADVLVKEADPFITPREAPAKTLRNVNLERLDDEQLARFIDSAAKQSPEFQIPNDVVGREVLQERARLFGTDTITKYLDDVDAGRINTPEGDIRRIASEVIAAENVLKDHMENSTMRIAKKLGAGGATRDEFRNALVTDLRLLRKVGGVSSEFGRALGSRRYKVTGDVGMEQRFLREVNKVAGKDANLDEIAHWMSNIDIFDPMERMKFLQGLYKATTREKIYEVFINSILSRPTTQIRNIVGNTTANIIREVERPFAATADLARAAITRTPRQRFYGESVKATVGLVEGIDEGVRAGWKAFMTEIPQTSLDTKFGLPRRFAPAIKGKAGKFVRLPSRFLLGFDEFFKAVTHRMEINARAFREASKIARDRGLDHVQKTDLYMALRANPTEFMESAAREEMLLRAFQTPLGRAGRGVSNLIQGIPGVRYLVPFVRVMMNLTEFTADRVPGLNVFSILNRRSQGIAIDYTEETAKTAVGILMAAAVYKMHEDGIVTGEVFPDEQRGKLKAYYAGGGQRYSIKVGDKTVSYNYLDPLSAIIGIHADTAAMIDRGVPVMSDDFAYGMAKVIANNVLDIAAGYGWDTLFELKGGDLEKASARLNRIPASLIPQSNFLRGISYGVDPTFRRSRSLEDSFRSVIPYASQGIEPILDIWGNEVVTEAGVIQRMAQGLGIQTGMEGRILDGLFNPVSIRNLTEDPATKEINRLIQKFPDEPFNGLGTARREIKGIELTSEEYVAYVKEAGQLAHKGVTQFINSNAYPRMPDEIKKKQIEKIILRAREQTKSRFLFNRSRRKAIQ